MNVFDEMDIYWAEIADQNSTERQIHFLEKTIKTNGLLLDLACGTGRHLIPLSQKGYNVVGLDLSPNLLKIAKNRLLGIQLVRGDMRFLPFKPKTFAVTVSMDTSFGYQPSEQDDLQSLNEIKETLDQKGFLIIDVFNREHLILKFRQKRFSDLKWLLFPVLLKSNWLAIWVLFRFFKWKEYADFFLLQKRTVTTDGEKLHDLWLVCDKSDGQIRAFNHTVRLFECVHLQGLMEKAGFNVNSVYGDYEGQVFSSTSGRLILVASKK